MQVSLGLRALAEAEHTLIPSLQCYLHLMGLLRNGSRGCWVVLD